MTLIKAIVTLALVSVTVGFERDENYFHNENETIVELFFKTMDISDYKVPQVDSLGGFSSFSFGVNLFLISVIYRLH